MHLYLQSDQRVCKEVSVQYIMMYCTLQYIVHCTLYIVHCNTVRSKVHCIAMCYTILHYIVVYSSTVIVDQCNTESCRELLKGNLLQLLQLS